MYATAIRKSVNKCPQCPMQRSACFCRWIENKLPSHGETLFLSVFHHPVVWSKCVEHYIDKNITGFTWYEISKDVGLPGMFHDL